MYTKRTVISKNDDQHIDFFQLDRAGRRIGIVIETGVVEFEDNGRTDGGYNIGPGMYFTACVQATRNGVAFGATQFPKHFKTEEECVAYVSKRISASRKAARKFITL